MSKIFFIFYVFAKISNGYHVDRPERILCNSGITKCAQRQQILHHNLFINQNNIVIVTHLFIKSLLLNLQMLRHLQVLLYYKMTCIYYSFWLFVVLCLAFIYVMNSLHWQLMISIKSYIISLYWEMLLFLLCCCFILLYVYIL